MSLILGLFLHTVNNPDGQSQHSMLMEFYQLDNEIEQAYNTRSYKDNFHDLNLFMKQARAKALLYALGIL